MSSSESPVAESAPASKEVESVIIDCTKANFIEQSDDFIKRLPGAAWIAIDEEMSGIQLPSSIAGQVKKDDTPEVRYPSLKPVSERYALIQLGVSLFEESEDDGFNVRRYKFTLFPPADSQRDVILNPGSVKFLSEENNCNLNEWIQEGIAYWPQETAVANLNKFHKNELKKKENANKPREPDNRKPVELIRTEDKDFHAKAMASLREWLDAAIVDQPGDSEGSSLALPSCNAFLRRALYQSIGKEYPNLETETLSATGQIRVWRLNAEERARRDERLLREGFEKLLLEKVGVWRVFLALANACRGLGPQNQAEHVALSSNVDDALKTFVEPPVSGGRKIPLIVHNGLQDLLFLLTHFHAPELPSDWTECKNLIHSYFPVIYDTKTLACEYSLKEKHRRTHLGALYEYALNANPKWNRIFSRDGEDQLQEQLHDAGYDSYCTGVIFHVLTTSIQEQLEAAKEEGEDMAVESLAPWRQQPDSTDAEMHYGRNKIHFSWSPYTIDLESQGSDPLCNGMSPYSTYRVSDIDPSVTTRDIISCLNGLEDSSGNRINFEIVWVNDVCFIVGATLQSPDEALFREHGKKILDALNQRFQRETIKAFAEPPVEEKAPSSGLWNLWGLLGSSKPSSEDVEESRPGKRRRTE
eukprot:Nitzschia sp. Nitz4//scaffold13_size275219//72416//74749//NITZ4_000858-RA/size275219-augustus-gene-0.257-mRNA-1//-1//CDS//3329535966//6009//frame0